MDRELARFCYDTLSKAPLKNLSPQELELYALSLYVLSVCHNEEGLLGEAAQAYETLLQTWQANNIEIDPDCYASYLTILMLNLQYEKLYHVALAGYKVESLKKAATIALSDTGLHIDGFTSAEEHINYAREADQYLPPQRNG